MRRREVLGSCGVLLFAGCTGSPGAGDGTTTTTMSGGDDSTVSASPSITGSSFSVTNAGCGSQDGGAWVSFDGEVVSVSGTVIGNNGCYRARLADAVYESASDTCQVVVEAFDESDPGQACTQCITMIEYEASVEFDGGIPGTVEVVHDEMGGISTVATAQS